MSNEEATRRLFRAALIDDIAGVRADLDAGADVNAKDAMTLTPLHVAAKRGHTDIAKLLLAHGANVNAATDTGVTPSQYASLFGHYELVELLQDAAKQEGHASRVTKGREDKGPPQVGG